MQAQKKKTIRIALAGNPNSGKTSVFNAITGAHQHVGNYPGVTVERKEGERRYGDRRIHVVDLPGTYSLTAYSIEEIVARNQIVDEHPDAVICVIDASNLERNLYLACQLKELGVPMVIALNMIDVADSRGYRIDIDALSRALDTPIVETVGHRARGIDELLARTFEVIERPVDTRPGLVAYGDLVDAEIDAVHDALLSLDGAIPPERRRWVAARLIEGDPAVEERFSTPEIARAATAAASRIERATGDAPEITFAQTRYQFISGVCERVVTPPEAGKRTRTERIDALVTHRYLGLPLFLTLMFVVFQLTFALGAPLMDIIEGGFVQLGAAVSALWPAGSTSPLRSLIVDGVIGGVGGVIVFLPNILLLFLSISLLEGTGYMARAAFIMDRVMHKFGLHGKSFIPMLIGFGCSIPAIMATRTLDNRRDRLTTMMVIPLVSCSARLPIYLLIIPAFFPPAWHGPMLWLIYVVGIAIAVVGAKLLRSTVFRGDSSPFLMELPPYKVPTFKRAAMEMWERGRIFLRKAGTMILGMTIVMWALTTFPRSDAQPDAAGDTGTVAAAQAENSIAGRIGHAMEPAIRPLGFDWKIGTGLIGAFAAKEVFVAQMGVVHAVADADENSLTLRERLRNDYRPLVAFCIMLFALISSPCLSTVAVTRRESNSWRWAAFQFWGLTAIAYVFTLVVYQVGNLVSGFL